MPTFLSEDKPSDDISIIEEDQDIIEKIIIEEDVEIQEIEKDDIQMEDEDKELPLLTTQKVLLILDASGSMWGQINGEAKIKIAKDVIKKTVKNFQETDLGLMVYGHRKKGDCNDIEILANPQKNNADNISKMVDGISPKGMTPMGKSVLMAAESLRYTEEKATVILVSDGIETCDIDLCALGKTLEETGIDFTAHVIGFDMTEDQISGLKCLANETGGKFISAKDADDLSTALGEVVEASSCSKEKLGEAVIDSPLEIEENKEFNITWTGPNNEDDVIALLLKNDENINNHLDHVSGLDIKNGEVKLKAPKQEGEYDIVYFADCGVILGKTSIKVVATSASLIIPESTAIGSNMKITWIGPNNTDDYIGIFPKDETDWNNHFATITYLDTKNGTGTLIVPNEIGEYDVIYWLGTERILVRESFSVIESVANFTNIPDTAIKNTKFSITWTGPDNKGDAITIVPKGSTNWNDHVGGNLYSIYKKNGSGELTAPKKTGEYDVIYWLNGEKILDTKSINIIN